MIIAKTPLRISFAGGGSDLKAYYQNGHGAVVSATIDKFMYVSVNKTFDNHIRVIYSKIEYVDHIDEIEHNLAREALKIVGITGGGLDISYMGDMLPAQFGSGLGASSALTVGILNALHTLKGEPVSAETLAAEACRIEIGLLGRPIGKQDQYVAAYGGLNYIRFNRDESVTVEPILCDNKTRNQLKNNLLLFYTGLNTHSDNILVEQNQRTPDNQIVLDKMVGLSETLKKALENNNLNGFGGVLHQGWLYKQTLATKITNSTIDGFYEKARRAGATGGKILGSGGGGFLLLYCAEKDQGQVRKALAGLREVPFRFEPAGSKIIYNSQNNNQG
ncbi:MAG: GHMP kinase [Chloroflexi bacterium RBG_16_56_11]|nr:MAG: GHMP kinase [Chloroflexi bacterium RBG_16_56_11]